MTDKSVTTIEQKARDLCDQITEYTMDGWKYTPVFQIDGEAEVSRIIGKALLAAERSGEERMRERAAQVNLDKTGREWVRDSLWDSMAHQFAKSIRTLKLTGDA